MTDNLAIWDKLSRTDPAHTKAFNRSGGFKGTAVKPIWVVKQLTEQFGPCGIGWGFDKPDFQVVPAEGEILVYCTVAAWHGDRANVLYGVGGDKVQAKRSSGAFNDDEAFKKAFTDAIGNAFKFIGMSADIHMGQFDDSKYVAEVTAEYKAAAQPRSEMLDRTLIEMRRQDNPTALKSWLDSTAKAIRAGLPVRDKEEFDAAYTKHKAALTAVSQLNS